MNLHRLQRKRHCFSRSAEEKEATAQRLVGLPIPLARLLMAALFLVTVAALLAGKAHSQGLVGVQLQQSTHELNFDEELPVGSELLRIPAVYQDASFNLFTDGVFSLRGENLALGDEDGGDSKYFEIISGGVESGAHIGVLRTKAVLDRDLPGAQTVFTFYVVYSVTSPVVASGEVLVAANLYDINDNSPVFSQEAYQVSLREDTPPGSSILDAIASDADQVETDTYIDPVTELFVTGYVVANGLVGSYVFTGGNELGDFAIDPDSGVVSVAPGVNLDVDLVEFYNLTVQAEDGGGRTGNATVYITILDSNDNQPQILDPPSVVNITIPEDTPTGFVILEGINATDADHGLNALVRFYITSGDVTDSFSINNLTGEVIVSGELDREQGASITLMIAARDQGQPPLQDTIEIKVFLLDINDYTPQFTEESYDVFVNENSAVDTSIFRFEAKDLDEGLNGTVTYSIVNDSTTDFYIDPTSGDLFTNTSIDREEIAMYHFVVQAVDNPENSTFQLSSTATVNVIVVDRNDNSPIWDNDAYLVEILESTLRPTSVFQALATDVDSGTNSEISYSFLVRDTTDPNHFSIDAITGDVRVNTNSLVVKLYEYKIRATDGGGRFSDVNISVNVHAINKKPPVFDPRQYNATLPENIAVGTLVLNVSAEDPDPGLIGRVRYRIASVFDEAGSFDVNPESGEVHVNSTLDFDSREEIFFMVEAYDGGFPEPMTDLANVTVFLTGVNDVPPTLVFPSGFQILVPENEPPEINVITLSNYTYDPDLGNGSEYVFAIAEIFDPFSSQNESSFSINSTTGLIVSHRVFDRELQPDGIVVTINTTDFGTPPLTLLTNITIMIGDKNDNPPYFDRDLNTTAYEFEPNGTLVYAEFQAIDADIGINAELTYAIVDGDENRDFYVDPATGIIYSTGKLNKTEQRYYNLTIRVRDGGLPQFEAFGYAFIEVIDANDQVPVFSSPVYNVSFPESSLVGTRILTVNATDSDIGTNALFEYFLLTANNSNITDRFAIDSVSGNISTSDTFDREVESFFTFQVIAIDKGSVPMVQTGTATVLIHIQDSNDMTPYFNASNYSATVVENTPNGTHVLSVLAYDNDAEYPNNAIQYSLTGNRSGAFHVNSSGDITISGEVDWEEGESFVMFAVATDMGNPPLSSDVMVTIYIVDVNDRAPIFVSSSLHLSVPENAEIGTEVGYVMAHDPDSSGNSSMFNFSVVEDYSGGSFKLDPESGLVTALATFDRETVDSYMLLIQARDFGTPQQARNATLVITISDRNDMDPEFESDHFSATISESLAIGSSVLTVNVSDGDIGTNAELRFSIVDISPASTFEINETTGEIYVAEDLDFEVYEVVTFIVIATDLGIPPRNDSTMVTVEITDFNDNRPVFLQNNYSDFLRENLAPGTVILRVNSTDADTENDAVTTYSLKETEGSENFGIHFQTGVLYTSTYIDREVMPSFQLIVIANNSLSKNPLCSEVDVEITMTDLNDNHPSFPLVVTFRIPEDTPLGSVVGTLEAKDGDKGPNGTISYQFIHGNEDGYFALESESGNVTLQNELDYENRTLFLIAVMATDGGLVNNSNYTNLLVQVLNTNDNPPLFASREYSVSVLGSSSKGDIVGTFTALDPDDDVLTYSISVGNDDGFFTTDMDSLVLARDLSSVAAGSVFNLTLVATDSMYEGTAVILIHVSSGAFGFHDTSYLTSVSELATPSATATLIDLSSEAFGQNSFNAIASGNNAGHFAVDSTGKVTLDKGGLDYETQRLYQLTIVVEDAGGNEVFSILNVEVTDDNDFGPEFPSDTIFIALPETASKNKPFFTLLTTDRDGTTTNRETVYTISSSMPPGSMGTFLVDPTSGELSLSDTSSLNYEEGVRNYTLVITAASSSDASLNSEVEVSISILNENSFMPVLPAFNPSTIQIEENSLNYTTISTAIATDGDIGSQGNITYGMFSTDHGYVDFFIDTFTGEINITEPLDWEKENSYVLRVVASDGGNPSRSAVRTLSVQVLDVNDNFPVWEQEIYSVMVQEDLPVGSVIIQVAASDLDQAFTGSGPDQNGYVTYSISSGGDVFAIDPDTGVVNVSSPLNREERLEYNLTLNATDGPGLYSNAYLHIEILDVNDVAPVFTKDVYLSPIAEDAAVGTLVIQVVAFDDDYLMENQEIAYSITEGNLDDTFVMNLTTGEVFLNATLDRESVSEYVLVVVAVDMGTLPQSGLASVIVTVLDKNEHAPVFSMQAYNTSVMENEDIGFTVLQVQATDLDSDLNGVISYSILNGSETGLFAINSTTGEVYVNGTIDYAFEQSQLLNNALSSSGDEGSGLFAGSGSGISGSGIGGSGSGQDMDSGQPAMVGPSGLVYVLVVEAQDNGPLNQQFSSTVNVTIFILDQNDNAPVFAQESYNSSISESTPPDSFIISVSAFDVDSGLNSEIEFSLDFGNDSEAESNFLINSTTGDVYLSPSPTLDHESTTIYNFSVVATDSGTPPLHSSVPMTITVSDSNDNRPMFLEANFNGTISEDSPINTFVVTILASDEDMGANAEIVYSIESLVRNEESCLANCSGAAFCQGGFNFNTSLLPLDPPPFLVDNVTGMVTLLDALDRESVEQYVLLSKATDSSQDEDMLSSFTCVLVTVLDVNDNEPVFSNALYVSSVPENLPVGELVLTVEATDTDIGLNSEIAFEIMGEEPDFYINSSSGAISTNRTFDRELQDTYNFTVIAFDLGSPKLNSTAEVVVTILDVNDSPPVFSEERYNSSIEENLPPSTFVLQVNTSDSDLGENAAVTYSILPGDFSDYFAINQSSGVITTTMELDRESYDVYSITVLATDGGIPSLSAAAQIFVTALDENDNAPEFTDTPYVAQVAENTLPNASLIRVSAFDSDVGDNAVIFFSIADVSPSVYINETFYLNASTGDLFLIATLDSEVSLEYNITVTANNSQAAVGLSSDTTVFLKVIDINDHVPVFLQSHYMAAISESAPVGSSLVQLKATDADATESNSVLFFSIAGIQNAPLFVVNSSSGLVSLNMSLDRESEPVHMFEVMVQDNGVPILSSKANVTVVVRDSNDNPPIFEFSVYNFTIEENVEPPSIVGQVQANDSDIQNVTYLISPNQTDGSYFSIDDKTGIIFSEVSFDRESQEVFSFVAVATDGGIPVAMSAEVLVHVVIFDRNDNPPLFSAEVYNTSWYENVTVGTNILTVEASDADLGNYSEFTFSIVPNNDTSFFSINSTSGEIFLDQQGFDRETQDAFQFQVLAVDSGSPSLTGTASVQIQVLDNNDNTPVLNATVYSATLLENTLVGFNILTAGASDRDIGKNAVLQYNSSMANIFPIDATTGVLTLAEALDYETTQEYNFTVTVRDSGEVMRSSSADVFVTVTDLNDNPPVFDSALYTVSIPENSVLDMSVFQIPATDADSTSNGELRYSILGGNVESAFSVDEISGLISTAKYLDREILDQYTMSLQVVDQGVPQFTATASLMVQVEDVNDHVPHFDSKIYPVSVPEDLEVGSLVLQVLASDLDTGSNAELRYTIVSGDSMNVFEVSNVTGEVSLAKELDFETVPSYAISLQVQDGGDPPLTDIASLEVLVTDVNEHPPSFVLDKYTVSMSVSEVPGTSVGYLASSDRDMYWQTRPSYSLQSSEPTIPFKVDPLTGMLYVSDDLSVGETNLSILATDMIHTTEVEVEIIVLPLFSDFPLFQKPAYMFEVPEHSPTGTAIGTVATISAAAAADISLVGASDLFEVTADGQLSLIGQLDREEAEFHVLNLRAIADSGTPFTTYSIVTISVTDVNDHTPTLASPSYEVVVSELVPIGTPLLTLFGYDLDPSGVNSEFEISISEGNEGGSFELDHITGQLLVAKPLDYEVQDVYQLVAMATNQATFPPLNSTALINIALRDENDNQPSFTSPPHRVQVVTSTPVGAKIFTLEATDPDSGTNSELFFSITYTDVPNSFTINSTDGSIYTGVRLDAGTYMISASVADRGNPTPLSDTTTLTVDVVMDNLHAPIFSSPGGYQVSVPETLDVGSMVTLVSAYDPDGLNGTTESGVFYYFVSESSDIGSFEVSSSTGDIVLSNSLDYLQQSFYQLSVAAEDFGYPPRSTLVAVNVSIVDVNNNPPEFSQPLYNVSVSESTSVSTVILTVNATDIDALSIKYEIHTNAYAPNDDSLFAVNSSTGELSVVSPLDRETASQHVLEVAAIDSGYDTILSNSVEVVVYVLDENDAKPTFTEVEYQATVVRLSNVGQFVVDTMAFDPDTVGEDVEYSLLSDGGGGQFMVNASTGVVTVANSSIPEDAPDFYLLTVQASDGLNTDMATVSVQVVSQGSFCQGNGFCTSVLPRNCSYHVFPYTQCIPFCASEEYELSPLGLLCSSLYCLDNSLFPCDATKTCLPPHLACSGKCPLNTTALCPTTDTCHVTSLNKSCDGSNETCLVGQTLVQQEDGSRYCTATNQIPPLASCSGDSGGVVYCELLSNCSLLTAPHLCQHCPQGMFYCTDTKICELSEQHCCGLEGYFCNVSGTCLPLSEQCRLPNVAPSIQSHLILLEVVDSSSYEPDSVDQYYYSSDGRVVGLLLSNTSSPAVDSQGEEVGLAIVEVSKILPSLGEWQFALCADLESDSYGGCSNVTSPWVAIAPDQVSEAGALVLPNTARLRFIRKSVELEGVVWIRAKLWDGNSDGYLSPSLDLVRSAEPHHDDTTSDTFSSTSAYSEHSILIVTLIHPLTLPPQLHAVAPLQLTSVQEDTTFYDNHGDEISALVGSIQVAVQEVLPEDSIEGFPPLSSDVVSVSSYEELLPPDMRSSYLAQVVAVNPTRTERLAAWESGQAPGVGIGLPSAMPGAEAQSGRWQVSVTGDEQEFVFLDSVLSGSNSSNDDDDGDHLLLLNTSARLRFLPAGDWCGETNISLHAWDGYVASADANVPLLGSFIAHVASLSGVDALSVLNLNRQEETASIHVKCVPDKPLVAVGTDTYLLDPIPYRITHHYRHLFTALVAMETETLRSKREKLEVYLFVVLEHNVNIVRFSPAGNGMAHMSFTVKGNALSLKELRSGVMERQEVLTELGLEILEISLDASYGPGAGCLGDTPMPYYGTLVSSLVSNFASDADGDLLGLVVVADQSDSSVGAWQYHRGNWSSPAVPPDEGASLDSLLWVNLPSTSISTTSGFLLHGNDRLRFLPRPTYFWSNTTAPSLAVKVWDNSLSGFDSNVKEISLLGINADPYIDTTQSLHHPRGLFSDAVVSLLATRYGCDGVLNSAFVHDACCVCAGMGTGTGTGTGVGCAGCNGGGSDSTRDSCDACGGNDESCLGCDFIPFSNTSHSTSCGECVSSTGVENGTLKAEETFPADSFVDCHGVCYGAALVDDCGVCSGGESGHVYNSDIDCSGVCFGSASIDDCGDCSLPDQRNENMDCTGVCGGPFRSDACGVCQLPAEDGSVVDHRDCSGTCFGSAGRDLCGVCYGGSTGLPSNTTLDTCGICGGDGLSCIGCDGIENSGKVIDSCEVCGGNNCGCYKVLSLSPTRGPTSGGTEITIAGAGFFLNDSTYTDYNPNSPNCGAPKTFPNGEQVQGTCRFISDSQQFTARAVIASQSSVTCVSPMVVDLQGTVNVNVSIEEKQSANTLKFVYDDYSTIAVTGYDPIDAELGRNVTIQFSGENFINSSYVACLVYDFYLCYLDPSNVANPSAFPAIFWSKNKISCDVPTTELPCQVEIRISLDGQESGIVTGPEMGSKFTFRFSAPQVESIHFTDDLASLEIQFDRGSRLSDGLPFACDSVFTNTTTSLLGHLAVCLWTSDLQRRITITNLSASSTLSIGSSISFQPGVIRTNGQFYSYGISDKPISVDKEINAIPPVAVLNGPTSIPFCGDFSFSGEYSLYPGYRSLQYHWSIFTLDVLSTPGFTELLQHLGSFGEDASRVTFSSDMFHPGVEYYLQLSVVNSVGLQSEPVIVQLYKDTQVLSPRLEILGPLEREISPGESLMVEVYVDPLECGGSSVDTLPFLWQLSKVTSTRPFSTEEVDISSVTNVQSPNIYIPESALVEDSSYILTLTAGAAQMGGAQDVEASSQVSMNFSVQPFDIGARIYGGDSRQISHNETLVLDARVSNLIPGLAVEPSYSWSCSMADSGEPCYNQSEEISTPIIIPKQSLVLLPASDLPPENTFRFTVFVMQGEYTSSANVSIAIASPVRSPPLVEIASFLPKGFSSSDVLTLKGLVFSLFPTETVVWQSVDLPGFSSIDLSDPSILLSEPMYSSSSVPVDEVTQANLVLRLGTLAPRETYVFRLTTANSEGSAFAQVFVTPDRPPHSAVVLVEPVSGVALETRFVLSAVGPVDSTTDTPLLYRFGIRPDPESDSDADITWLTGTLTSNSLSTVLPSGTLSDGEFILTIIVRIYDRNGGYSDANVKVNVQDKPELQSASFYSDTLDQLSMVYESSADWVEALSELSSLMFELNKRVPGPDSQPIRDQCLKILLQATDERAIPFTQAHNELLIGLVSSISTSASLSDQADLKKTLDLLEGLTQWYREETGQQVTVPTDNIGQSLSLLPLQLLSDSYGQDPTPRLLTTPTSQQLLEAWGQMYASATPTEQRDAGASLLKGLEDIGYTLCQQSVQGENPSNFSTDLFDLWVQRRPPSGSLRLSDHIIDFGDALGDVYRAEVCQNTGVACSDTCVHLTVLKLDPLMPEGQATTLTSSARDKISMEIEGSDPLSLQIFSQVLSTSISQPFQNQFLSVSGLQMPIGVYIPFQPLPLSDSRALCIYRENGGSTGSHSEFVWAIDSTAPPAVVSIDGTDYYLCESTHLTDFAIGVLDPPVVTTPPIVTSEPPPPTEPTSTPVPIPRTSSVIPMQTPTPSPPPVSPFPVEAVIIPFLLLLALAVAVLVVVALLIWRKKKRSSKLKIAPVDEGAPSGTEEHDGPSGTGDGGEVSEKKGLLPPEESKVPMSIVQVKEDGEKSDIGVLNVLPSIRLRELRYQLSGHFNTLTNKPFYFLTRQLTEIEPATEQQQFVSLVFGDGTINLRLVASRSEVTKKQFCVCGNAAQFECSGCGSQGYCTPECQARHWTERHQRECTRLSEKRRRSEILQRRQLSFNLPGTTPLSPIEEHPSIGYGARYLERRSTVPATPVSASAPKDWKDFLSSSKQKRQSFPTVSSTATSSNLPLDFSQSGAKPSMFPAKPVTSLGQLASPQPPSGREAGTLSASGSAGIPLAPLRVPVTRQTDQLPLSPPPPPSSTTVASAVPSSHAGLGSLAAAATSTSTPVRLPPISQPKPSPAISSGTAGGVGIGGGGVGGGMASQQKYLASSLHLYRQQMQQVYQQPQHQPLFRQRDQTQLQGVHVPSSLSQPGKDFSLSIRSVTSEDFNAPTAAVGGVRAGMVDVRNEPLLESDEDDYTSTSTSSAGSEGRGGGGGGGGKEGEGSRPPSLAVRRKRSSSGVRKSSQTHPTPRNKQEGDAGSPSSGDSDSASSSESDSSESSTSSDGIEGKGGRHGSSSRNRKRSAPPPLRRTSSRASTGSGSGQQEASSGQDATSGQQK